MTSSKPSSKPSSPRKKLPRALLIALAVVLAIPAAHVGQRVWNRYLRPDVPGPYDRRADAQADIGRAVDQARRENRRVLVMFGANWCPECRRLADDLARPALGAPVAERFVTVKVDIGHFDRNGRIIQQLGNPVDDGIPALVVLDATGQRQGMLTGKQVVGLRQSGEPAPLLAALDGLGGTAASTLPAARS